MPVERKARGEYALDKRDAGGAKNNELVLCEPPGGTRRGLSRVRVVERIGSMDSPTHHQPDRHSCPRHSHRISAKPCWTKPRRRSRSIRSGRTDLRAIPLVTIDPEDARDHDDAVWAGPDDDAGNQGGHVVLVAIADVAHYVTPGSALDKEASSAATAPISPTASCRCCRRNCRPISAR